MKVEEKRRAIHLRKVGYTINQIAASVDASKSTVSLWVRNLSLSRRAQAKISARHSAGQKASQIAHRKQTAKKLATAREEASVIVSTVVPISTAVATVACALLYWCEGAKSIGDSSFSFSNSDPVLVGSFLKLLRQSFPIDESKFRVCMHLHSYHHERMQREFWQKVTGIPKQQFIKTFQKPNSGKTIHPNYPGCIQVRYHDVSLARKIQAVAREFLSQNQ